MDEVDTSGQAEWRTGDGALQLGHCRTCDAVHYYPRRVCPFCFSVEVGRKASSGRGTIYSYSLTGRGPQGPYVVAYVTLDEGVSILTNIIDADPESLAIDQEVELIFHQAESGWVPFFRPRHD